MTLWKNGRRNEKDNNVNECAEVNIKGSLHIYGKRKVGKVRQECVHWAEQPL
jgi:hypothetical protein